MEIRLFCWLNCFLFKQQYEGKKTVLSDGMTQACSYFVSQR